MMERWREMERDGERWRETERREKLRNVEKSIIGIWLKNKKKQQKTHDEEHQKMMLLSQHG